MTNEQKAAVQKAALAAARSVEQRDTPIATAIERSSVAKWFKAGAQTILENPGEFGLCSLEIHKQAVKTFDKITMDAINAERATVDERNQLQSQLTEYREVLERLLEENMCSHAGDELIEEALKQEVNND